MPRTEPFGIDVSKHNGNLDPALVKAFPYKIEFAGVRSGESWGYEDPKYKEFVRILQSVEIRTMPYHVLYPMQPIKNQVDKFLNVAGTKEGIYWWDIELIHGATQAQLLEASRVACYELLNRGLNTGIYTSPVWFNGATMPWYVRPPAWLRDVKWWLAQYLYLPKGYIGWDEHPKLDELVKGITFDQVYIHQTTSTLPGMLLGQPSGSPRVDGNRKLQDFWNGAPVEPPPSEPNEELVPKTKPVEIGRTLINGQCVRTGIGTDFPWVTKLVSGQEVEILGYGKDNKNNSWVRLGPGLWAAQNYAGREYIQQVME